MALENAKAFGIKAVKITDLNGSNPVDLPAGRYLRFAEVTAATSFELDGVTVGVNSKLARIEWELESGGISLYALAKLAGQSAVLTGSSPNAVLTLEKSTTSFPYVRLYGRSLGDEGDDVHCKILKAKLTSIDGVVAHEQFIISTCRGIAVPDASGVFMQIVVNETATSL